MTDTVFEDVREFLLDSWQVQSEDITQETEIDIGIFGIDQIDADDFMYAFAEKFEVDMSGFQFEKHFPSDAYFLPQTVLKRWLSGKTQQFVPISIRVLCKAAKDKKWPTEIY